VAELCRRARPRRTVLTHQYPAAAQEDLAAAIGRTWDGPVHQARDDEVFVVGEEI
jgi:ribonuclease BN (tRNA processing enzyme)